MNTFDREAIRNFGWTIQHLIGGRDLTRERTYEMFCELLRNEQPELQQGAFLAALTAKGETAEEIVGAWAAIREIDTTVVDDAFEGPLVDNSGTGMDALKTFNVSSAAAIVAASAGIRLARHGARGLSSACGTVDVLEALGIDVDCPVSVVADCVRRVGIGLFNGMSPSVHPGALGRILSQIRFGSTLNIAASLASPCRPTHGLRGVHSVASMCQVMTVMQAIGYRRAMVVHGWNADRTAGMDELSTLGETEILELDEQGKTTRITLTPESVGLKKASAEDVASSGNVEQEATRLLSILSGTGDEACRDLVCLNAGALFYLVGRATTIHEGVALSRTQLGAPALHTLTRWVQTQSSNAARRASGLDRLHAVAKTVGIHLPALG